MAEFKHKKCGGIVKIDLAGQFTLRTHSVLLTPSEFKLGVLELNVASRIGKPVLVCGRCDTQFDLNGNLDNVTSLCLVCGRHKPVPEMSTSFQFPAICESCINDMSGKSKKEMNKLAEVLDLSVSSIKFIPFVDVLSKPIS